MVDYKDIAKQPEKYKLAVKHKNSSADIDKIVRLTAELHDLHAKQQELNRQVNANADQIKQQVSDGQKPASDLIEKGKALKTDLSELNAKLVPVEQEFSIEIAKVPNLPSDDTPIGQDEEANVVLSSWGKKRDFSAEGFKPLKHHELGEKRGLIETNKAAKISGSRFAFLQGDLVRLQFALIQFGISKITDRKFIAELIAEKKITDEAGNPLADNPFTLIIPPVIINPEIMQKMARLEPREERYHLDQDDQYLVGSAEHTLGPLHMDEIIPVSELPIRYLGYSTAFRREAGSYGKDIQGIFRLHQFDKLEMESFSPVEAGLAEQNLMVAIQERLMQLLEIPYQVIICSTGDQGDPDARHIDIEAWLPGQGKYRETHSADYMSDYQSRRLNTRYTDANGNKQLVHMNDATAFAIGRTLIAIMENFQQADGTIIVPEVLRQFAGVDKI